MHACCGSENLGFLHNSLDLRNLMNEKDLKDKEYHLNMTGMYIRSLGCASQSMGIVEAGFQNMKKVSVLLDRQSPACPAADPPLEPMPNITRQAIAYALALAMLCVCYSYNESTNL